jgi:hypothetical protein
MPGNMLSVAGFVGSDGELNIVPRAADCTTAGQVGIDDSYIYSRTIPSTLDHDSLQKLNSAVFSGVKALGLQNTPIHAELIYTVDGPKIIEIAARIGGFRPRMYEQASGIDMYAAAIQTAYGSATELVETRQLVSTIIELFPEQSGMFEEVVASDQLQRLSTFQELKLRVIAGQSIGKARDGFRAAAIVNLVGTAADTQRDMSVIREHVRVKVV